jgi:carbon storage regulator
MLILSRRLGECVTIGNDIVIKVIEISGNQIRLGIDAPREVRVLREEIYKAMREENRAAAAASDNRRLEDVLKQFRGGGENKSHE